MEGGQTFESPLAQHGFSALVTLTVGGQTHRLLFDNGTTPDGLITNMHTFDISPKDIETIVLSHGHFDHTTGLDGLARTLGRTNLPVMIHPDFWNRRRLLIPGRIPFEIPTTSKSALQGVGFEVIEERQPSFLLDNALLVTGEVDRTTAFECGVPGQQTFRGGSWVPDPIVLDDQAVVIHVQDKGLVVMTGCGHAGIANIMRYAQKLTGMNKAYAILGGFHLNGSSALRCKSLKIWGFLAPAVAVRFRQGDWLERLGASPRRARPGVPQGRPHPRRRSAPRPDHPRLAPPRRRPRLCRRLAAAEALPL
jgi:7,8-dihydropterin-6-yl-methyl-4-(beta-D-ribofuranosyl)aminobenzene 5'-phosphate synthase